MSIPRRSRCSPSDSKSDRKPLPMLAFSDAMVSLSIIVPLPEIALPRKALCVARIDVDDVAGRFGRHLGGKEIDGFRDVLRQHRTLEQGAPAVVFLEFVRAHVIGRGALFLP